MRTIPINSMIRVHRKAHRNESRCRPSILEGSVLRQPWCGAEDSGRKGTTLLLSCGSTGGKTLGREDAPLPPKPGKPLKGCGSQFSTASESLDLPAANSCPSLRRHSRLQLRRMVKCFHEQLFLSGWFPHPLRHRMVVAERQKWSYSPGVKPGKASFY